MEIDKVLTGNADEDKSEDVTLFDTLSYSITASNTGNVTLTNVVVTDSLTGDSLTCPSVAVATACVLNVTYNIDVATALTGEVRNVGRAESNETPPVEDEEVVEVVIPVAEIGLGKAVAEPIQDFDTLSYLITYTLDIGNYGNVILSNVQVTDNLDNTFGAGTYSVISISSSDLTVNPNFNGSSDITLLRGNDTLVPGEHGFVSITAAIPLSALVTWQRQDLIHH